MKKNPSVKDLPPGWKPGDSGVVLDDSSIGLPSDEELLRALDSDKPKKKEPPQK